MTHSIIKDTNMGAVGGDFIQHCYSLSVECTKIHILSTAPNWRDTITSVINGITQEDAVLKKRLYDHLPSLGITLKIEISCTSQEQREFVEECAREQRYPNLLFENKKCDDHVDLLIVEGYCRWASSKILTDYSKYIGKGAIVGAADLGKEYDGLDKSNGSRYENFTVYRKHNPDSTVNYDTLIKTMYQYELVEAVHTVLTNHQVRYCATEGTCLGCIRNRSQLIGEKLTICREAMSQRMFDEIATELKSTYGVILLRNRIHFEKHPDTFMNVVIDIEDPFGKSWFMNKITRYPFGPTFINTLDSPNAYLETLYGTDVFKLFVDPVTGVESRDAKRLYDCEYNYWSPYTSQFWKDIQIGFIERITYVLKENGIPYWLDGGSCLGAIRDGNIPLFDDDVDIGVFKEDFDRVYEVLLEKKGFIGETPLSNKIYLGKGSNISLITTFKTLGVSFSHNPRGRLNEVAHYGRLSWIEIMGYYSCDDTYICDDYGHISGGGRSRIIKTAVPKHHYDKVVDVSLGNISVQCPSDPQTLLESAARYGPGTIKGPARRGKKTLGTQHSM